MGARRPGEERVGEQRRVRRGRPMGPGRGERAAGSPGEAPARASPFFLFFFRLRLHAARLGISRPRTSPRGGRAFPAPSDFKRLWPSGAVKRPWLERANVPAASTAAPTRSFWKRLLFPATRPLPSPRRRGSFPGLQARTAASSPQAQLLHGGRPPAPVGSPAVSRTHSAVFSRAIKRQRKMDHRGWKWGEVPLDLRCARGDDLKRFSHLLFRSRAGGMNTPRAAILRISAPARGAGLRWPEAGAPAPTSGLAEGGGAAGKQTRAAPEGAPCQRAVPQGWLGLA